MGITVFGARIYPFSCGPHGPGTRLLSPKMLLASSTTLEFHRPRGRTDMLSKRSGRSDATCGIGCTNPSSYAIVNFRSKRNSGVFLPATRRLENALQSTTLQVENIAFISLNYGLYSETDFPFPRSILDTLGFSYLVTLRAPLHINMQSWHAAYGTPVCDTLITNSGWTGVKSLESCMAMSVLLDHLIKKELGSACSSSHHNAVRWFTIFLGGPHRRRCSASGIRCVARGEGFWRVHPILKSTPTFEEYPKFIYGKHE